MLSSIEVSAIVAVCIVALAKLCTVIFPRLIYRRMSLGNLRSKVSTIGHRGSRHEGVTENTSKVVVSSIIRY